MVNAMQIRSDHDLAEYAFDPFGNLHIGVLQHANRHGNQGIYGYGFAGDPEQPDDSKSKRDGHKYLNWVKAKFSTPVYISV